MFSINEKEIHKAQEEWGDGLVMIGDMYKKGGDYQNFAREHIRRLYAYDEGLVLFKPTLAHDQQFRTTFEGALSYFVGGNPDFPEDHGFALKPWVKVKWETIGILIFDSIAITMGNYYFTPENDRESVKVEFSISYKKGNDGKLKIIHHDSHLPFNPNCFIEAVLKKNSTRE